MKNVKPVISVFEEVQHAGKGLLQSVQMTAASIKNAWFPSGDEKPIAKDEVHASAAGQMQYAPKGSTTGGAAVDRKHAQATYDEIDEQLTVQDQRSINDRFPDSSEAAMSQSHSVQSQHDTNKEIKRDMENNLHNKGP